MKLTGSMRDENGNIHNVTINVDVPDGVITTSTTLTDIGNVDGVHTLQLQVVPDAPGDFRIFVDGVFKYVVDVVNGAGTITHKETSAPQAIHALYVPDDTTNYAGSTSPPVQLGGSTVWPTSYDANAIIIGGETLRLAAINPETDRNGYAGGRGWEETVLYTYHGLPDDEDTLGYEETPTNEWGVEIAIGSDGRMLYLNDRIKMKDKLGTDVPQDGGVISGHGSSGEALRRLYEEGAPVQLVYVDWPVSTGKLPAYVVGGYWQQYQGPEVATLDVEAKGYNLLWAAFALGNGGQHMTFRPVVQDSITFEAQMKKMQERGVVWGISMGGGVSANAATICRTKEHAKTIFTNMKPIIADYGFQGVDDDFENGPGGFTEEGLTELFRLFREEYGPDFVLASTPRPYETFRVDIAANLYKEGYLDLLQWQFYDSKEYKSAQYLKDRVRKELTAASEKGVPLSAQIVGAITRTTYKDGWNHASVYRDIVREWKAKGLRGSFVWEVNMDKAEGWNFEKLMVALDE